MKNSKLIAAEVIVYAGEDDQCFTFITAEAYTALELWMKYRSDCGEQVTIYKYKYIYIYILTLTIKQLVVK
jgi:hypothetical protein